MEKLKLSERHLQLSLRTDRKKSLLNPRQKETSRRIPKKSRKTARRILNLESARHVKETKCQSLHSTHQANVQGQVSNLHLLNLKRGKKFKRRKTKL